MGQATEVRPTMHTAIEIEPVATLMVEEVTASESAVALADIAPAAATLENAATTVERNLSPNLKKKLVIVLEEEV